MDIVFGELLLERGMATKEQLDDLVRETEESGLSLRFVADRSGLVSEEKSTGMLSEHFGLPFVRIRAESIDSSVTEKVPLRIATYYKFVPLRLDGRVLTIAVSYPFDVKTQDEVRTYLGFDIKMALASEDDIDAMLKENYGLAAETIRDMSSGIEEQKAAGAEREEKVEDIDKLAEDASVIKLVNQVIMEAYRRRATDIHIEPYRGRVRFRYRIDGVLQDVKMPEDVKHFLAPMLSRIKIMANMNIVEKRLPQDGRAVVKSRDEILDLRISSIPTPHGESVVIRLLPTTLLYSLESLGLAPSHLKIFHRLISKPHGMIFITGPTGSGKTTTLYACLTELNKPNCKIVTIEDPVEYEMEGITQIQVSAGIGLDFAKGLRSTLRHDPNVVMVGEVRDIETAEIAVRASLTGHLVFSTLHTNDAASGVTRLVDIGVEPYLIASSLEAIIAQRLVRTICPHCKEPEAGKDDLRAMIAAELDLPGPGSVDLRRGAGCDRCNSSGFHGRTAVYELLLVDGRLKEMILNKASANELKRYAVSKGMATLRQDGWQKVLAGLTTPEEVINVAPEDKTPATGAFVPPAQAAPEVPGARPAAPPAAPPPVTSVPVSSSAVSPAPAPSGSEIAMPSEPQMSRRETDPAVLARRTYSRTDTKVSIHYKILDDRAPKRADDFNPFDMEEEAEQTSVTKDLSAGGAQFFIGAPVSRGTIFELGIDLPDGGSSIECLARVERVEEIKADEIYCVAVCFLDMARADRARVDRYVREGL